MKIDETALTKGQIRKLNSLRKSVGAELGTSVFTKWLAAQQTAAANPPVDKVAAKIIATLESAGLADDRLFRLGNYGYTIRKARGKGATGFVATKNAA